MIEVVHRHELPFVEDGSSNVIDELTEQLGLLIDGDIPGVGITHTAEQDTTHRGTHQWHRNLFMRAVILLNSSIDIDVDNSQTIRRPLTVVPDWLPDKYNMHGDLEARLEPRDALRLKLRLHTSGEDNGAEVILVNSAPGFFTRIGDTELFGDRDTVYREASYRGYDGQGMLFTHEALSEVPEMAGGDVCVTAIHQPEIYSYTESPLSSVLFRTQASMGSVSIHGFRSIDSSKERYFYTTDFYIGSQAI